MVRSLRLSGLKWPFNVDSVKNKKIFLISLSFISLMKFCKEIKASANNSSDNYLVGS